MKSNSPQLLLMERTMTASLADTYITADHDFIIIFPRVSRTTRFTHSDKFTICRELGMGPYWNSLCIQGNDMDGDTFAFNTSIKLPVYPIPQLATVAKSK